jgi:hypothetical protein
MNREMTSHQWAKQLPARWIEDLPSSSKIRRYKFKLWIPRWWSWESLCKMSKHAMKFILNSEGIRNEEGVAKMNNTDKASQESYRNSRKR